MENGSLEDFEAAISLIFLVLFFLPNVATFSMRD